MCEGGGTHAGESAGLPLFRWPWEPGQGVRAAIRARVTGRCEFYPSGKIAFRDALDALATVNPDADNVLLPAYVPSGVPVPVRDADYTPRYYRITPALRPELEDVNELVDEGTLAIVTVNYFGFPQPDHAALREIAADAGAALIEDNAHAALSETPSGALLGTRGDLGFASFHKTMPVPDGAVLYLTSDALRDAATPRSGIRSHPTRGDLGYLLRRSRERLAGFGRDGPRDLDGTAPQPVTDQDGDFWGRAPEAIYERSKGEMSLLTKLLLDQLQPEAIVAAKRRRYRGRRHVLAGLDGVRPVYADLDPGVCPQSFPLVVDEWGPLCERLGVDRTALPRWPPLPRDVATRERYRTSRYLAEHLVPLPV